MRISAKADYAVRAAIELAVSGDESLSAETVAKRQDIPVQFLQKIFLEMRIGKLVATSRGRDGGHQLARPADQITIADILRVIEGPLADVHGVAPESLRYQGSAEPLQGVWVALRSNIRVVLEAVTLADLAHDRIPKRITTLSNKEGAWVRR